MDKGSTDEVYLVRSETLSGFTELVRELGADPTPMYHQVGLKASLFQNVDYMVPYASVASLMEIAAAAVGRDDFGLLLGSRSDRFNIGVLWPLIFNCPDVVTALEQAIEYFHLHSQGLRWELDVVGEKAYVFREDRVAGDTSTFQYSTYSLILCFKLLRTLCESGWRPLAVNFVHSPPLNRRVFDRYFKLAVKFDQERSGIVFPSRYLNKKLAAGSESTRLQIINQLQGMEQEYDSQQVFISKVDKLIHLRMHTAFCTQSSIAAELSMHPKALQRALHGAGMNFRKLTSKVLLDMA